MTEQPLNRSSPRSPIFHKVIIPILLILAVIFAGLWILKNTMTHARRPQTDEQIREGGQIADFTLTSLDGKEVRFSELKGKVFLINFWATWCESCLIEMPSIVALWQNEHQKGFEVISINVDESPQAAVPPYAKKLNIGFPIYRDEGNRLGGLFDVHAIPLNIVVNAHRQVLFVDSGERDWNSKEVHQQLDQWLATP